jgi:hypothetical protein
MVIKKGTFFVVESGKNRIKKVDITNKENSTEFWRRSDCGPHSISSLEKSLVVSCYNSSRIYELDREGNELREISTLDFNARPLGLTRVNGNSFLASMETYDKKEGLLVLFDNGEGRILARGLRDPQHLLYLAHIESVLVVESVVGRIIRFKLEGGEVFERSILFRFKRSPASTGVQLRGLDYQYSSNSLWVGQYGRGNLINLDLKGNIIKMIKAPTAFPINISLSRKLGWVTYLEKDEQGAQGTIKSFSL